MIKSFNTDVLPYDSKGEISPVATGELLDFLFAKEYAFQNSVHMLFSDL